jgi:RNA polymerase sigma factor (sigma-70 family)
MPTSPLTVVIQHLLAHVGPDGGGMTDAELLARFLNSRDKDALAALVRRHAPMVWGVCCRLLPNHHDAEDAFQATFFVLVRKAADVPRQAIANWLYGVARQTAVRLRATAAKRGRRERQVVSMPEPTASEARDTDLHSVLDEELSRLPNHYRCVVLLCDLEGRTRKEAARHLGIPEGSVASRLARARAFLAKRLTRRGIVLSGSMVALSAASAPPALVASTIEAASRLAEGQAAGVLSAKVAALTEGVVKAMFVSKIKGVLAAVLVVGLALGGIGTGVGLSTNPVAVAQQPGAPPDNARGQKPKAEEVDWRIRVLEEQIANLREQRKETDQRATALDRTIGELLAQRERFVKQLERKLLLPGEIKQELNRGVVLRVRLVELDPRALRMTADVEPTRGQKAARPLRLANLGIAGNVRVSDGKKEMKLTDLKAGNILRLQLESWKQDGEEMVVTYIRVEYDMEKPKSGKDEKQEKLRVLIDRVLLAHGGEDRLNKLQFTMKVKHNNGITHEYFIQPPDRFRSEEQQRDEATKLVTILFHNSESNRPGVPRDGRATWIKHPNGKTQMIHFSGLERPIEWQLDRVKFFGPRQVLRLKDADQRVALLDEEVQVGGRAAVGVEVIGPQFKGRMYFDKETHLLAKLGSTDWPGDSYYSDYKKFGGIPIAQKEKQPGYMETEVIDFRTVDHFDAKLFEEP